MIVREAVVAGHNRIWIVFVEHDATGIPGLRCGCEGHPAVRQRRLWCGQESFAGEKGGVRVFVAGTPVESSERSPRRLCRTASTGGWTGLAARGLAAGAY